MNRFDVLNRKQSIQNSALLEASAGTGKTFAIENIVVRLLIEGAVPLTIEKILVVTFTRAATRDLKARIRKNIETALSYLKKEQEGAPDYLAAILESGPEQINQAIRRLEHALFTFDQSHIYTIHSFCWLMMKNCAIEVGLSFDSSYNEDSSPKDKLLSAIRDFLRTQLLPEKYSPAQLAIALEKNDLEKLERKLLSQIERGIEIKPGPFYSELLRQFQIVMQTYQTAQYNPSKIMEDFVTQAPYYKEVMTRSKKIHTHILEAMQRFAALFDQLTVDSNSFNRLIKDGLVALEIFDSSNRQKKAMPDLNLHYPEFLDRLRKDLAPLVNQARSRGAILSTMAAECQAFVRRYQQEEELLAHNDLLTQMEKATDHPEFVDKVRKTYLAAIIDEFQDTDPVQWKIFSSLFLNPEWKGYLYIVGDPKQSIYAFRQADIYTYIDAASKIGKANIASLDTNFRSRPALVQALNTIFQASEGLFPLPQQSSFLPFHPVRAGKSEQFFDEGACVQFWMAKEQKGGSKTLEKDLFFPAIAHELMRLKEHANIPYGQCAILISDKHQAKRIAEYLATFDIPVKRQKAQDLAQSTALSAMRELLHGVLHLRDESALKTALATPLIGMNHDQIAGLNEELTVLWTERFTLLRNLLKEAGFAIFYSQLMLSCWHKGQSVLSHLLRKKHGADFYGEWQDLADLLIDAESSQQLSPEGLITYLNDLELSEDEDPNVKSYVDRDEEGVNVLTTHVSKGLEYDAVFALGLSHRPRKQTVEQPIMMKEGQKQFLGAVTHLQDPRFIQHCEECDAEKMRQLYVAFTRARYRLYIPTILYEKKVDFGNASPIELLLAKLDQPLATYEEIYARINSQNGSFLEGFVKKCNADISLTQLDHVELKLNSNVEPDIHLSPPPEVEIPQTTLMIHSFTSLSSSSKEMPETAQELIPPHNFLTEHKSPHTLPSGNETGILLHTILETIPFAVAKDHESKALLPWIAPLTAGNSFAAWNEVLADIIFKALITPLPGAAFCLSDIDPKRMFRETEFLYPSNLSPGYLKGIIDLIFEHEDKYYLIDWKSNWLGPTNEHYHAHALTGCMKANQYDLQSHIYVESLKRYLSLFDSRPFETIFGGAYYYFLRGVTPTTGIYKKHG